MTLTAFLSEHDSATRRDTGNPAISLADLKSRRVPVEWFEAVAIVQELCRALLESRVDPEQDRSAAKGVFIDPAGSVRIAQHAGEPGEPAIRQVGELLRTSLAESAFPVPLRLVITQASSTPPFYASIAELSNALEYFERPDRAGLVRAVYERAQGYQPAPDLVNEAAPAARGPEAETSGESSASDSLEARYRWMCHGRVGDRARAGCCTALGSVARQRPRGRSGIVLQ